MCSSLCLPWPVSQCHCCKLIMSSLWRESLNRQSNASTARYKAQRAPQTH
uniref:Uncharacterized protein n=1 Tax=Anguilla anguilla TaxID=7936 RepID=A0A0E9W5G4_ANGAN